MLHFHFYLRILTILNTSMLNTSDAFGKLDFFTSLSNKHITTDTMHCIQVTNSGASNLTESPLRSALFTNTVTIETTL